MQTPPLTRHSLFDNLQGQAFGVILISLGLSMLHSLGLITGQIAGLAFLLSYVSGYSFATVFSVVNIPFYVLAYLRVGHRFTLHTILCVTAVSVLTHYFTQNILYNTFNPLVGTILAGVCIGVGSLGLFRHEASAGGVGILAVYVQDKTGFRAGWLQLIFDIALFIIACFILSFQMVIYSLLGAVVLNLLVAWNHRKEWYVAR